MEEIQKQPKRVRAKPIKWGRPLIRNENGEVLFVCQQTGDLTDKRYYLTLRGKKKGTFAHLPAASDWILANVQDQDRRDDLILKLKKEWQQDDIPTTDALTPDTRNMWENVPGGQTVDLYVKENRMIDATKKRKPKKPKITPSITLDRGFYVIKPGRGKKIARLRSPDQYLVVRSQINSTKQDHAQMICLSDPQKGVIVTVPASSQPEEKQINHTAAIWVPGGSLTPIGQALLQCSKKFTFTPPEGVKIKEITLEEPDHPETEETEILL